jgi:hypothetical protein
MQKIFKTRKRHKLTITKITSWALLAIGTIALAISIIYASSILALIGLGLTFWGALLSYIKTEEYIKKTLLDATALPQLTTLNQLLQDLDFKGKAVYLPPKYFKNPETTKIYITEQENWNLPQPEQIQEDEDKFLIENNDHTHILFTPIGTELAKLMEKTLGTSFTRIDIDYLQRNLPKALIEDLEIAQNLEIEIKENIVNVKIENTVYKNLCYEFNNLSRLYDTVGCPISSAIACALVKATGKPIIIENRKTSEDGKNIKIEYHILQEE